MQKYWWYQTEWHSKMDKSMQVNGMGESTREAYLRSMRQLVEHYDKTPDQISEDELLDYFIHRQDVTAWSPATRGADRRRGPCRQAQLACAVPGVRSSALFRRKAPGQGT